MHHCWHSLYPQNKCWPKLYFINLSNHYVVCVDQKHFSSWYRFKRYIIPAESGDWMSFIVSAINYQSSHVCLLHTEMWILCKFLEYIKDKYGKIFLKVQDEFFIKYFTNLLFQLFRIKLFRFIQQNSRT